jgi:hypothetical protein
MKKRNFMEYRKSVITAFIEQKIRDYINSPEKLLYISDVKYAAAACCLVKHANGLKGLAKELNIGHGLLRKWRTEDRFLNIIDQLELEFPGYLIKYLERRSLKAINLRDDYFSKPITEMAKTAPAELSWTDFYDIPAYSQTLILRILGSMQRYQENYLNKAVENIDYLNLTKENRNLISILNQFNIFIKYVFTAWGKKQPQIKKMYKDFNEEIKTDISNEVKHYLMAVANMQEIKGKLKPDNIKGLIYYLHVLNGNVNLVDMEI